MAAHNPFAAVFSHFHFHVAQLEPSVSSTDPITVLLTPNPRTDTGYDCISYDRSRAYETSKIVFAGSEVDIPTPLQTALRALREKDKPRLVWADVLLGQTPEQRSELAKVGTQVLQNASTTIAWLGPGDEWTAQAFSNIKTLAIWWHQAAVHSNFPESLTRANNQQLLACWTHLKAQDVSQLEPENEKLWDSMLAVFASPYFNSVQTIPDVVLASSTVITCGSSSLAWSDMTAATNSLMVIMGQVLGKMPSPEVTATVSRIHSIEIARRRYHADEPLELLPMVQTARDVSSADLREYVFSMLPICRPSKRQKGAPKPIPLPVANYTRTVEEVFTEAAKFMIEDRTDLFLWWSERPPHARKLKNMPSWVPDWTCPLPSGGDGPIRLNPPLDNTTAPSLRAWSDSVRPWKRITVEDDKLCLQAHKLDRIAQLSQKFTTKNYVEVLYDSWKRCPAWAFTSREEGVEALWRTMLLNVGGPTDTFREQAPPLKEAVMPSLISLIAQGQILERLNCTMEQLNNDKELQARARSDQYCQEQGTLISKDNTFERMLLGSAVGRRFFVTEKGRMGMTAFEELPAPESKEEEEQAKTAEVFNAPQARDQTAEERSILPSPLEAGFMQDSFLNFIRQRDPAAAASLAEALKLKDQARGAKIGDIIVAAVGGFSPYVLRSTGSEDMHDTGASIKGKEFKYVGDCYLHGVMKGEPFSNWNWLGSHSWKTGVVVDNIKIV